MKSVTKLKDDARRHELREDWEKAIEVYLQVVRVGEQGEADLELPLYNRIGDLYVRVGKPAQAVGYYEQAADRYAEAGLFNNAIALCNKALRYAPDHLDLLRKLGQFSASQGFLTDARRWYLEYAERAARLGQTDEALSALENFADIADDAEVRELLGHRLHEWDRHEAAVDELRRAYRMYLGEANEERAEAVRTFLAEIAPDVSLEGELPETPTERRRDDDTYTDSMLRAVEAESAAAGESTDTNIETGSTSGDVEELTDAALTDDAPLAGLMPTAAEDAAATDDNADALEGFQPTSFENASEHTAIDLPELEPTSAADRTEAEDAAFDLPELEPTVLDAAGEDGMDALDAESLDAAEPTVGDAAVDLPLLHDDGVAAPEADTPDVQIEDPLANVDEALGSARTAVALGNIPQAIERLNALQEHLSDEGAFAAVAEELNGLVDRVPDEIRLHQVRVEFAERSGRTPLRLHAYLELARALERTHAQAKADAIYEHVLEIDPANAAASRALKRPSASTQDEYVDLKSLLDLDGPSGETRYFVEETEPTGDEDNDFAAILSQFKAKLAEHVAPEDAGAHYDLGIAFKEMGLVDEAIAEFQVALRAGDERLKIYEELGHCFLLKQQYTVAAKVLGHGLDVPSADELDRIGIYYHLGVAYEQLGRTEEARDAYERVMSLDVSFRDVSERLAGL